MSQQGPIIVVSAGPPSPIAAALSDRMFPVVETSWFEATPALEELQPAAVLTFGGEEPQFAALAAQVAGIEPYVPLIVIDPKVLLPANALPFAPNDGDFAGLDGRVRAALRVRSLHASVLLRLGDDHSRRIKLTDPDPLQDASVLLIGRGAAYPALSVALGERMGVVGALSIEAAARHLNLRELDGIVLGEGFSARVVDAFLTVLAEDTRFRNLPIVVTGGRTARHDLPNLEFLCGEPARVASSVVPMVRQHAFEARLARTLKSIDSGGLLDSRTGLLTLEVFNRNLAAAVEQTRSCGGGLSIARFCFGNGCPPRAQLDGARLVSRLMRRTDFGTVKEDGSVLVVFTETDLRNAHMVARRLSSVMKHTIHAERELRLDPELTVATVLPSDSAQSLLARLTGMARRIAS